jgi:arylsulfate sulfotransferase
MFKFIRAVSFALTVALALASEARATVVVFRIEPGSADLSAGQTTQFRALFIEEVKSGPPGVLKLASAARAFRATVGGTSRARLVHDAPAGVALTWEVNGVVGGNSSVGTITSNGLYTAPSTANAQVVAIKATGAQMSGIATVRIVIPGTPALTGNPLVAALGLSSPSDAMVSVRFGTDTSYSLGTWPEPTPAGGGHVNVLVAGMRASTVYHMQLVADFPDGTEYIGQDQTVASAAVAPALVPQVSVSPGSGPAPYERGVELLSLDDYVLGAGSTQAQAAVVDPQGNLIWYFDDHSDPELQGKILDPAKLLANGDILFNFSSGFSDGAASVLREIDLAGNTVWELTASQLQAELTAAGDFPGATVVGTHHDFLELPDGDIIVLVSLQEQVSNLTGFSGTVTVTGDGLVELDHNHNPAWTWSAFDHLDVNRHPYMFPDWTHANAIIYSPDDHNLIVSSRHQSWIIKIDYNGGHGTGNVIWRLGYQGDFALQDGTDPVDWFYAQHGPWILSPSSTGVFTLGVMDNGNDRVVDNAGDLCGTTGQISCTSRAVILQIDETKMTATLAWQDNLQDESIFGGDVRNLPNGDIEISQCASLSSSDGYVFEVTPDASPQLAQKMTVVAQHTYRAERLPSLYPGVQW